MPERLPKDMVNVNGTALIAAPLWVPARRLTPIIETTARVQRVARASRTRRMDIERHIVVRAVRLGQLLDVEA